MIHQFAQARDYRIFDGKVILITGGTGSFGSRFCETILDKAKPKKLIIYSRDELKQSVLAEKWQGHEKYSCLRFFLGDVRDEARLDFAFRGVDFIVHAAALKQVVAAEYNPFEAVKTNIIGAQNIVSVAIRNKVRRIVALSTDKAANPINIYGATKLASDKIFISANFLTGDTNIKFGVVRYGNVINSRGSVIPLFNRLIKQGVKNLPITDERMTRFIINLEQGVGMVVKAFNSMGYGEILIPKIPSIRITDLAKAMNPNGDFEIKGIRPGEKLHELMVSQDDARNTIEFDDHYRILPELKFHADADNSYYLLGKKVAENFEYNSLNNPHYLMGEALSEFIKDVDA